MLRITVDALTPECKVFGEITIRRRGGLTQGYGDYEWSLSEQSGERSGWVRHLYSEGWLRLLWLVIDAAGEGRTGEGEAEVQE